MVRNIFITVRLPQGQRGGVFCAVFWVDKLGHVHLFSALRRDGMTTDLGGVPERLKGTGCKPVGYAYVGSNPTSSTTYGAERVQSLGVNKGRHENGS